MEKYLTSHIVVFLTALFLSSAAASAQSALPANVVADPISACVVDLSWDEGSPGADYFSYQRSTRGDFASFVTIRKPLSGSLPGAPATGNFSEESTGLVPGTSYWYRVRACDNLNLCSSYVSAPEPAPTFPLPSVPEPPAIQSAIANIPSGSVLEDIVVSWDAAVRPSDYGGFSVFRSDDGAAFSFVGYLPMTDPSQLLEYRDLGLNPASEYTYRIYAYDSDYKCPVVQSDTAGPAAGNRAVFSGPSNVVTIFPRPTNLSGSLGGGTSPTVNLSWDDNSGNETVFEIFKSINSLFPPAQTLKLSALENATTLEDSAVNPNTTYYYKVRACEGTISCSAFSNIAPIATGLETPALSASIIYTSNAARTGNVYVSWQGVLGATSYSLERSTSSVFDLLVSPPILLKVFAADDEPAYYDINLDFGEAYHYRVTASGGGFTARSNIEAANMDIVLTLKGVGWSGQSGGGVGWIKFNSLSEQGSPTSLQEYSVQVDSNGLATGLAWAGKNYGWLSFNKADLVGCPSAPCEARFDSGTDLFSGWARFLNPKIFSGSSAWDGWVSLRGSFATSFLGEPLASLRSVFSQTPFSVFEPFLGLVNAQISDFYGVTYNRSTRKLTGMAWGGEVGGWIGFGADSCTNVAAPCTVRADVLNASPQVTNVSVNLDPSIWCANDGKSGGTNDIAFRVNWAYSDPEGDTQNSAEVRFTNEADPDDELILVSPGIEASLRYADPLGWVATGGYGGAGYLDTGKTYRVAVRVNDGNSFSGWLESPDVVQTPPYYYPLVEFDWSPSPANPHQPIGFNDKTINRSSGASPSSGWSRDWQFPNGNPPQSGIASPNVNFSSLPSDVVLTITDPAGVCSYAQTVLGDGSPPPLKRRQFRER